MRLHLQYHIIVSFALFIELFLASKCESWFTAKPERCQNSAMLKWCWRSGPEICKQLGSGEETNSVEEPQSGQSEPRDKHDESIMECCMSNRVSLQCLKYCTLVTPMNGKRVLCEDPDCLEEIAKIFFCCLDGKDLKPCCLDAGVDEVCGPFCDGQKELDINVTFSSPIESLAYQSCQDDDMLINQCAYDYYEGVTSQTTKKWRKQTLSPVMRQFRDEFKTELCGKK